MAETSLDGGMTHAGGRSGLGYVAATLVRIAQNVTVVEPRTLIQT